MNMPPLPKAQWLGDIPGHTSAVLQAYGQACARQALEDAAQVCDAANPHPDEYSDMSEFTERRVALKLASQIRSLK